MLPEAAAVITVLANDYHHATATTMTSRRHLTRSLSRALHLDSNWSTGAGDIFRRAPHPHAAAPAHRRTDPLTGANEKPTWPSQSGVQDRSAPTLTTKP